MWRRRERQDEKGLAVHGMILCSMGLITFDADPRAEKHLGVWFLPLWPRRFRKKVEVVVW